MQIFTILTFFFLCGGLVSARSTTKRCGLGEFLEGTQCSLCPVGTFQDQRGATACKPCPPGTFSDVRGIVAVDLCQPCPRGTFFAGQGNPSLANCKACPPGQSSVLGAISCIRCKRNTFLIPQDERSEQNNRTSVCQKCNDIGFTETENAVRCSFCQVPNRFRTPCYKCRPGFGVGETSRICERCLFFDVSDGTTPCRSCPRGFFNPKREGGSKCIPCPPGTTSTSGRNRCVPCPQGTVNGTGSPFCLPLDTPCPENHFFNNQKACQTCTKSERFDKLSNECVPCSRNKESDGGVDETCRRCARDRESGPDGVGCVCREGFRTNRDGTCQRLPILPRIGIDFCFGPFEFIPPGRADCLECPSGQIPILDGTACEPCPSGTRRSIRIGFREFLRPTCVDPRTGCPPGTERREERLRVSCVGTRAIPCPNGTALIVPSTGTFAGIGRCVRCIRGFKFVKGSGCVRCPPNSISPGGLARTCERCPKGLMPMVFDRATCGCVRTSTHTRGTIDGECRVCPRGTFGDRSGDNRCQKCPPGHITRRTGSSNCQRCGENAVPNADQSGCVTCKPGTASFNVGETRCVEIGSLNRTDLERTSLPGQ